MKNTNLNAAVNPWQWFSVRKYFSHINLSARNGRWFEGLRDGNLNSLHVKSSSEYPGSGFPRENCSSPNFADPMEIEIPPRLEKWSIEVMWSSHVFGRYGRPFNGSGGG